MTRRRFVVPAVRHSPVLLLWATLVFFLWMFLAANSLERTAEAGRFVGGDGRDIAALAERYSYDWRHGMVGGWPLYTPGFFAVAIAAVLWSRGRTNRRLLVEGSLALVLALLAAKLLAPVGARWLIVSFEHDKGAVLVSTPVSAAWSAALTGIITVVGWVALMVSVQVCVTKRSLWRLTLPLTCYIALMVIRPGEFGELTRPWVLALRRLDGIAIGSTALIPLVATILWRYCVRNNAAIHPHPPGTGTIGVPAPSASEL